jgi:hypothetical protein
MISETLSSTTTVSASTTLNPGNAQMIVTFNNANGDVKLIMTEAATGSVVVYRTSAPRSAIKIIVVADATITWHFEYDGTEGTANVYLAQQ